MNFDRVADIYDATRGLPPDVSQMVADRIVEVAHAGRETRFLELGVGTGRIALPLVRRGFPFTGVDISELMLQRFREKVGDPANLTLVQSDVTDLPLPDGSQDVVVVIHVFHLIPEWRKSLAEARRVLLPGGYLVWGGNDMGSEHEGGIVRRQWSTLVKEMGGELRPRYADWQDIHAEITSRGGYSASYRAARWTVEFEPADLIEALHNRVFSAGWHVPDDILEAVHEKMLAWGRDRYGDISSPVAATEEFTLFVSRWP